MYKFVNNQQCLLSFEGSQGANLMLDVYRGLSKNPRMRIFKAHHYVM